MHIEIQKRGGKKHYYLAHSYRTGEKVRKIRKYLGADLSKKDVEEFRKKLEPVVKREIEETRRLTDPYQTALPDKDLKIIEDLIQGADIRINHLSEDDWAYFTNHFTFDTNAIEGSTVTEKEVKNILGQDKWPGGKSRQEIAETYGVAQAIQHIRETKEHLSLKLICALHKIVFSNSKPYAGKMRENGVEVVIQDAAGNVVHRGAPQPKIKALLKELVEWYGKNSKNYHPIVLAAVVHNQFESIHPFQDGNGRIGRLLLNNILLKHDAPPVNIELVNRMHYYQSLQAYQHEGNLRPTIELILKEYKRLQKELKTI